MENNTNLKFIPHENEKKQPKIVVGSFVLVLTVIVFIVSLIVALFFYVTRVSLNKQIVSYNTELEQIKIRFNEGIPVRSVKEFDKRLVSTKQILDQHKSFNEFFKILEKITLKNVQIISLTYSSEATSSTNLKPAHVVRMIARAPNYKTIAETNEQFSVDEEARRYFTDVVFSNLFTDDKRPNTIDFEVEFKVDETLLSYLRQITAEEKNKQINITNEVLE